MDELKIRGLEKSDIESIASAFLEIGWNKPASQYEKYLSEQDSKLRVLLVAFVKDTFAGYVTIKWESGYAPFRESGIPEINDFNVLPTFRRRGIGTVLMDQAERMISERSEVVGLGVGLHPGYGPAQRMYVLRGYVPDARAMYYNDRQVQEGEQICADDDLVIHLTKQLRIDEQ